MMLRIVRGGLDKETEALVIYLFIFVSNQFTALLKLWYIIHIIIITADQWNQLITRRCDKIFLCDGIWKGHQMWEICGIFLSFMICTLAERNCSNPMIGIGLVSSFSMNMTFESSIKIE